MRTWSTFTPEERQIFTDKLHYGHLLERDERDTLYEMEISVWTRPLTDLELRSANEILDFVKDADLAEKSAA